MTAATRLTASSSGRSRIAAWTDGSEALQTFGSRPAAKRATEPASSAFRARGSATTSAMKAGSGGVRTGDATRVVRSG